MSDDSRHNTEIDTSNLPCLPEGWRWVLVGELLREPTCNGISVKGSDSPPGIPALRLSSMSESGFSYEDRRYIPIAEDTATLLQVRQGDFFVSRGNGSLHLLGRSTLAQEPPERIVFPDTMIRLRFVRFEPLSRFINLLWASRLVRSQIEQKARTTAGIYKISQRNIEAFHVPLPPLNEQQRIVAKIEELFSDLDAGIAALERIRANLKRYRAAVLKAAVEGKLTEEWRARHPKTEPATKLLERILIERRQKWEEEQLATFSAADKKPPKGWREMYVEPAGPDTSTLPKLPLGWCWVALGQVARFQNGRAFPSKEYASEGMRLLRPGNLFADGSVRWTEKNSRFMPSAWAENHPTYIIRGDELVMNLTAQSLADEFLGRICLTDPGECCLLNQRLARITPYDGMHKRFTLYLLKSAVFRRFVNGLNTGSLIEHMFTSQLEDCYLPMPPAEEQHEIVQEIERRFSVIEENDAQVDANLIRAVRLRQSILKRAFEGKLVPQDPTDEPADKLLERIRQERAAANGNVAPRARRSRASKHQAEGGPDGAAS